MDITMAFGVTLQKCTKGYTIVYMVKTIYRESRKVSEGKITQSSNSDICQITTELLKTASQKLKSGKSDPLLNVTLDFFLNAPPILYDMLTAILRGYITHAHISDFLLVSNLIPIVKDKLADMTSSNNYRSIAISSLVMKIFDWVIILAFSKHLKFDDLQFGYQANVSTSMCTWTAVISLLNHYMNFCRINPGKAFLIQKGYPNRNH